MDQDFFLLNIAVVGASALQSATGIGFGVIAGPILLILLNDGSAIQVSVALNLLIALILAPSLRRQVNRATLKYLVLGLALGSPLGIFVFLSVDVVLLKIIAGIAVVLTLYFVIAGNRTQSSRTPSPPGKAEQVSIGIIGGVMGVCLAMPGPIPAAWMSARSIDKDTIRATILAMFVFAYTIAMGLQFALAGITTATLALSASLVPATIVGILVGHILSRRISETIFRRMLLVILAGTVILLFANWGLTPAGT